MESRQYEEEFRLIQPEWDQQPSTNKNISIIYECCLKVCQKNTKLKQFILSNKICILSFFFLPTRSKAKDYWEWWRVLETTIGLRIIAVGWSIYSLPSSSLIANNKSFRLIKCYCGCLISEAVLCDPNFSLIYWLILNFLL